MDAIFLTIQTNNRETDLLFTQCTFMIPQFPTNWLLQYFIPVFINSRQKYENMQQMFWLRQLIVPWQMR